MPGQRCEEAGGLIVQIGTGPSLRHCGAAPSLALRSRSRRWRMGQVASRASSLGPSTANRGGDLLAESLLPWPENTGTPRGRTAIVPKTGSGWRRRHDRSSREPSRTTCPRRPIARRKPPGSSASHACPTQNPVQLENVKGRQFEDNLKSTRKQVGIQGTVNFFVFPTQAKTR